MSKSKNQDPKNSKDAKIKRRSGNNRKKTKKKRRKLKSSESSNQNLDDSVMKPMKSESEFNEEAPIVRKVSITENNKKKRRRKM